MQSNHRINWLNASCSCLLHGAATQQVWDISYPILAFSSLTYVDSAFPCWRWTVAHGQSRTLRPTVLLLSTSCPACQGDEEHLATFPSPFLPVVPS